MTANDAEPIETLDLVGGAVCLDFVNTASRRQSGPLRDRLRTPADLIVWGEMTGVVSTLQGARLRAAVAERPVHAAGVLERARALRESVYTAFTARARGEATPAADLERLSAEHAAAAGERRLANTAGGVAFLWPEDDRLEQILWPVALSAAELLTVGDVTRVKECGSANCNWLFYDASKNRSRRWCEMKDCGNRAKARRYYARHHADIETPGRSSA
jgi:predicted RNA-binding Zn ribbon-like protein